MRANAEQKINDVRDGRSDTLALEFNETQDQDVQMQVLQLVEESKALKSLTFNVLDDDDSITNGLITALASNSSLEYLKYRTHPSCITGPSVELTRKLVQVLRQQFKLKTIDINISLNTAGEYTDLNDHPLLDILSRYTALNIQISQLINTGNFSGVKQLLLKNSDRIAPNNYATKSLQAIELCDDISHNSSTVFSLESSQKHKEIFEELGHMASQIFTEDNLDTLANQIMGVIMAQYNYFDAPQIAAQATSAAASTNDNSRKRKPDNQSVDDDGHNQSYNNSLIWATCSSSTTTTQNMRPNAK